MLREQKTHSRIRSLFHRKSSSSSNTTNTLVSTPQADNLAVQLYSSNNSEASRANQHISIGQSAPLPPRPKQPERVGPNKYGLFRLDKAVESQAQPTGTQYPVDIVAVHGMNGDAYETWTTQNSNGDEVNWLRDFLPEQFPGARIFSYGYPADIFWTRETGDISSAARGLLEGLVSQRFKREVRENLYWFGSKY